mmetsp:Transcript_19187/g.55842  ORF Transcript_19187/g.55842 Transcript_19187/m.55842 type:complete len:206 (+) Transcript_19187:43-660(+)
MTAFVLCVIEFGDTSWALRFGGLRKYRLQRTDLIGYESNEGRNGNAPESRAAAIASEKSNRNLSYSGRQLRDAILSNVTRECELSIESMKGMTVEAYDRNYDGFVSLMCEGVRDIDVSHRFGSRVRSVIHGMESSARKTELGPKNSVSDRRDDRLAEEKLAIQGRFFPYDPDGIDYAGMRLVVKEMPNNQSDETGLNVWDGSLLL